MLFVAMIPQSYPAFILKIKGHCCHFSRTRCLFEGEYRENRTCFPYNKTVEETQRTHNDYNRRTRGDHHTSSEISCIAEPSKFGYSI